MRVAFSFFLALGLAGCAISLPTAAEAGISYKTEASAWPADVACLNAQAVTVAKEVFMGSTRTVVIAGGADAISDDAWATYSPSLGNRKNSNRHLLFTNSCFSRSPGVDAECSGDACRAIVDLDGYTWVALSRIDAADCLPADGGCDPANVRAGQLLFVVTEKCHELRFTDEAFFLRGPNGEVAVMHATADGNPTTEVELPAGWSVARESLADELVVHPFGGDGACFYNIIRDHRLQSYHQIAYAGARYP
jgi:hypothetical protein